LKSLLYITFIFSTFITYSQINYEGVVYSNADNFPMFGVKITETETLKIVTTDFDGKFKIESKTGKLIFEYAGMLTQEISLTKNKNLKIILKIDEDYIFEDILPTHRNLWFTISTYSDIKNAPIGISIGNGVEQEHHIHFEEHTHKFTYEFYFAKGIENSNKTYGGKISLTNLSILGINLKEKSSFFDPTFEFNSKKYSETKIENFSFKSNIFYSKIVSSFIYIKLGTQKLNTINNKGISLGLNNRKYENYNFGADIGYWKDYFTYKTFFSKFIYKKQIMGTIVYDRIDNYNFFNMKIDYLFKIRKKRKLK
jgi:hypothetical protein